MDISHFDIVSPSEEGRKLIYRHPSSGQPLLDPATKEPVWATFKGRHSTAAKMALREIQDENTRDEAEGRLISDETRVERNARYLASMITGWSWSHWTPAAGAERQELPCTHENAVKFFRDPRFAPFRTQSLDFVGSDGNFMPA
jgi:hypothetical protein